MADSNQRSIININQFSQPSRYVRLILLIVLIAQIIFITWSRINESSDESDQQSIIKMVRSQVKHILIEKKKSPKLRIQKSNGNWVLPDRNNKKVSTEKVDVFLAKLLRIKTSWPIAKTTTSIQEFQVATTNYLAKIELTSNTDQHVTLFLGLSPGVNSTYARIDGTNDVYRIPFNTLDLSTKQDNWFDAGSRLSVSELDTDNNPGESNSQLKESKN